MEVGFSQTISLARLCIHPVALWRCASRGPSSTPNLVHLVGTPAKFQFRQTLGVWHYRGTSEVRRSRWAAVEISRHCAPYTLRDTHNTNARPTKKNSSGLAVPTCLACWMRVGAWLWPSPDQTPFPRNHAQWGASGGFNSLVVWPPVQQNTPTRALKRPKDPGALPKV